MKILFIGPLPPPLTGHSLIDKILLDKLIARHHDVDVVDLSKDNLKSGNASFKRSFQVLNILKLVFFKKKKAELIYFTISESIFGNIKDILIYLICFRKISKMIIHLHGGSLKKYVFEKNKILFLINKFFISRLGNVIISGQSHKEIFNEIIDSKKLIVRPNFAEDFLFIDNDEIINKFSNTNPLNILFLSNLIEGKGQEYLLEAYLNLNSELKKNIKIDFAGSPDNDYLEKTNFFEKAKGLNEVTFHGFTDVEKKKELLAKAHILCFPSYLLEGQGLVVLEAYASGCVVITTGSGGIKDVFTDQINGYEIKIKSSQSLRLIIEEIMANKSKLFPIALFNKNYAYENYRSSVYLNEMLRIIETLNESKSS